MAAKAEEYLQQVVDWYLVQDDKLTPGAAPHMQSLIFTVVNLIDPVLGCMLPSHPAAKGWAKQGLNQLAWQLPAWSDEDGGWIEALELPHHARLPVPDELQRSAA